MEFQSTEAYSTVKEPTKPKWWIWVAAVVGICCCITVAGLIGVFAYFGREPEALSLEYDIPGVVQKGENFELVLTLTNTGTENLTISSIDLDEAFGGSILDGSTVLDTEPAMEKDYSLEGIKTFNYGKPIQPGETKTLTFHLQATEVGEFGGSIGVYVGDISKRIDYVGIVVQE
jgi:hypothetical protein